MPQQQLNALIAVAHQLPEIAKQLKIANELKAIEIKWMVKSQGYFTNDALNRLQDEIDSTLEVEGE